MIDNKSPHYSKLTVGVRKKDMNILDWIGYVFGYVIFFGYKISGVYVVGLILFTIVVKLLMLPMSIKQQKTSAKQARIQPKIKELQEMYRSNPSKLQEEQQKLYQRENISMTSGCLPLLIQFPVIIGLYRAIVNPLTCVLHLSADKVNQALQFVTLPSENYYYKQSELINQFASIRDKVVSANIFTPTELTELDGLSNGAFNLFHINLLQTPTFNSILVLIPLLCFVTSIAMTLFTMRGANAAAAAGNGCTKWGMPVGMAAFSTWLAFTVPAAVGFYWIIQNVVSIIQTLLMNKFYNAQIMEAMDEAARFARREMEEEKVLEKYSGVDIEAVVLQLKAQNTAVQDDPKDKADHSIYEDIDAKNVIKINPNERVIKTGNATRAGNASSKKKKK